MIQIHDRVLFLMPKDRELQFPAMAVLQNFVNDYDNKMRHNPGMRNHSICLEYDVRIDPDDWQLFQRAGLKLVKAPQSTDAAPDMIIDLREERVERFKNLEKHVAQIYGIMSGVGCMPIPEIRKVKPKVDPFRWVWLCPDIFTHLETQYGDVLTNEFYWAAVNRVAGSMELWTGEHLLEAQDDQLTGVIGYAGWETYLAASMGLAVVEILPPGRSRAWLSKFVNHTYRIVELTETLTDQIRAAVRSVEVLLCQSTAAVAGSSS